MGNTYTSPGFYTLNIPSDGLCDSIFYIYIQEPQFAIADQLYIPNVFSPNGDNQNDELTISTDKSIQDYRLSVYDRYGQQVWSTSDMSQSWDGRSSTQMVNIGVYIVQANYKIEGSAVNKVQVEAVTVVR